MSTRAATPIWLLCAGFGTRMGRLTEQTPKPLLEVGGRPLLDRLLEQLAACEGLGRIELMTNSRYREAFGDWAEGWRARLPHGLEIHDDGVAEPRRRLGAVGDLGLLVSRLGPPERALVAAGDNLFLFPLAEFWQRFVTADGHLVLALEERDRQRLRATAVLEIGAGDRVLSCIEKPTAPASSWSAPALYGLRRSALEAVAGYLAGGGAADALGSFVAWLVQRQPVRAYRCRGRRLHVGTAEGLREAERAVAAAGGGRDC